MHSIFLFLRRAATSCEVVIKCKQVTTFKVLFFAGTQRCVTARGQAAAGTRDDDRRMGGSKTGDQSRSGPVTGFARRGGGMPTVVTAAERRVRVDAKKTTAVSNARTDRFIRAVVYVNALARSVSSVSSVFDKFLPSRAVVILYFTQINRVRVEIIRKKNRSRF